MSRGSTWCAPFLGLAFPSWRQVFNLSVSSQMPISHGDAPPGRQRFRRSEIPTCHPGRHGTHNKSDILLVSSTFADPGFRPHPSPASIQARSASKGIRPAIPHGAALPIPACREAFSSYLNRRIMEREAIMTWGEA